jgi:hypothetical protein
MKPMSYVGLLMLVLSVFFLISAASAALVDNFTPAAGTSSSSGSTSGTDTGAGGNSSGGGTTASACDLTGTWDFVGIDTHTLVITQSGNTIHGDYVDQSGKIDGVLSGNSFTGTWSESPTYKGPNDAGKFVLTLASDCNSLSGTWGYDQASTGGHTWVGTKKSGSTGGSTGQATSVEGKKAPLSMVTMLGALCVAIVLLGIRSRRKG